MPTNLSVPLSGPRLPTCAHLWFLENLLDLANTKRPSQQQVDDAQAGAFTETFMDLEQFHADGYIRSCVYSQARSPSARSESPLDNMNSNKAVASPCHQRWGGNSVLATSALNLTD